MTGFGTQLRDDSPTQLVRTVGRLAGMLVELRDEYVARPRESTIEQIEQRLDELLDLREALRTSVAQSKESAE